jgi:hypothetical protein
MIPLMLTVFRRAMLLVRPCLELTRGSATAVCITNVSLDAQITARPGSLTKPLTNNVLTLVQPLTTVKPPLNDTSTVGSVLLLMVAGLML